ncbi:MAG: TlpA family protein disulfide reductase [Chitinophagales bacterium]|nr:TlpA family protein disulfide reductase [Chitinophagales bacterium]
MLRFAFLVMIATALTADEKVQVVNLTQLRNAAEYKNNDTLYVVNFWATWCKPCVAEMPYFARAAEKFSAQKVKVVFVNLNSVKDKQAVEKFAATKNITQEMLLLNAGNPNGWIDSIDATWGGSIPATAMYKGGRKVFFYEGEFTQTELDSIIKINIE